MKKQIVHPWIAVIFFLLVGAGMAQAQVVGCNPGSSEAQPLGPASDLISNFHSFGCGLFRGARPGPGAFEILKTLSIKTVIDLQGGDLADPDLGMVAGVMEPGEDPAWISFEQNKVQKEMGMNFKNVPIDSLSPIDEKTGEAIGRLITFMSQPENQPIFIHCEHGADRTGLVVALYRVFAQHYKRQQAYDEMIAMGHGFMSQVVTGNMDSFFWAATAGQP